MSDLRRIYLVQGLRAFVDGFGSVTIGAALATAGLTAVEVGVILGALLAGSAMVSLLLVRRADRVGRRRTYVALLLAMGASGAVFALTDSIVPLVLAALTGTVSVDVIESGPFTSLEQAMIPEAAGTRTPRAFGTYNAIAAVIGSVGALASGGPAALGRVLETAPAEQRWLLLYPVAAVLAAAIAGGLSPAVESGRRSGERRALVRSRGPVLRLSALFALDSFGGGFIVQSFIVYWFIQVLGATIGVMAVTLAAAGLIQTASFLLAPRIAARIGLLNTMVFTHLPSNVLLVLIPFAPSLPVAIALLLGRFTLSQMDVPARQAYLAALAGRDERAAAAAVTNATRTAVRPIAPLVAGATLGAGASGLPFFLAGGLKAAYDVLLLVTFRGVPLPEPGASST